MDQLIKIVIKRLEDQGINPVKIPFCIESIANLLFIDPAINCLRIQSRMQSLGWYNFEIDEHTLNLIRLIFNGSTNAQNL